MPTSFLQVPVFNLLEQLQDVLAALTDPQYTRPVASLSNSSIGQHMRHIIEFYLELRNGYASGMVNYDKRKRDHLIETNRSFAVQQLQEITRMLDKPDRSLLLAINVSAEGEEEIHIATNYFRELAYNLEHTVHHMALLRIGIAVVSDLSLPDQFGVAMSTLKYRKLCAQ